MAKSTTKTATQKTEIKKPAAAKKRKLDTGLLERLADGISQFSGDVPQNHIDHLVAAHGMKTKEEPKGSTLLVIDMAGVKTKPVPKMQLALTNWANKARREVQVNG